MANSYLDRESYPVVEIKKADGGSQFLIPGLRTLPLSACNKGCGGFRFQYSNSGGCYGGGTCCYEKRLSKAQLAKLAVRYVRKCPVCERHFVGGGGRASARREHAACPDPACQLTWAKQNPGSGNTCAVCGQACLTSFTVTTAIMPHLFPDRLFVGAEFCLCAQGCLAQFRKEALDDLRGQARELIEEGVSAEMRGALRAKLSI